MAENERNAFSDLGMARLQFFRLWTAMAVLGTSIYLWFYKPEYLTVWKRSADKLVEAGSSWLPYPWGDDSKSPRSGILVSDPIDREPS